MLVKLAVLSGANFFRGWKVAQVTPELSLERLVKPKGVKLGCRPCAIELLRLANGDGGFSTG